MRFRVFCLCFFLMSAAASSQVRDLFAEFDEETKAAESSATVSSSSEAFPVSSSVLAVSSSSLAENVSSSAVSSSSLASSSSVLESSSSSQLSSSAEILSSSSSADVALSSSPDVSVADSLDKASAAFSDSLVPSDSSGSGSADSLRNAEDSLAVSSSSSSFAESSSSAVSSSSATTVAASSSSISRRDILGPVKVSKVYGIDEMKGRYKSPRKALFFSLVVPGAGQLYVGGSKFNYVRGAAYLALEAGLWGSWYYYSVYKYDRQVSRYKKFARNHFKASQYEEKMHDLRNSLDDSDEEAKFVERYLASRESYCKSIYGKASTNRCYIEGEELTSDINHVNHVNGKFSLYNSGSYYSNIASSAYVLGWDDIADETPVSALNLSKNSETVPLGTSANLKIYRGMRNKANDYADMQAWFFGGLILNHLVSAVDAAWAAHAHNKVLYEEELSWFDRLRFEGGFVPMNSQSVLNVYFNF